MKRKFFFWEECMNLREVKVCDHVICLNGGSEEARQLIDTY